MTRPEEMMSRPEARELLMQLLFQMEMQNNYSEELKIQYLEENFSGKKAQRKYAQELSEAVLSHLQEIDHAINASSSAWKTGRMAKVDLAILRLATGEILYMSDVPDAVAINEAVDIAKKYSTDESKRFVNGILGQVVKNKNE